MYLQKGWMIVSCYTCFQGEYWNVIFWYTLIMVVNLLLVLVLQGCRNWVPISNFSVFAFLPHLGNCFILGFFISKRIGLMGVCLLCQIPWNLCIYVTRVLFFYSSKSWYGKNICSFKCQKLCFLPEDFFCHLSFLKFLHYQGTCESGFFEDRFFKFKTFSKWTCW